MVNFPNLLSISRIILILPFIFFVSEQRYGWALGVFIVAALTDAFDGTLARLLHQRTVLGAYLDPAADKLLMMASFITLALLKFLPAWLAVLVILRDVSIVLGIIILRATSRPLEIRPSIASKLTTLFQFSTIIAVLLFEAGYSLSMLQGLLIAGTTITTIVSGLQYIAKGIKICTRS